MKSDQPNETTLKWGLLCTANINRRLIPAIRAAERAELLAVSSRSQERAEDYAAEWDIPRAHGSYEAMLEDPDIDALYISLPNSLHAEWTIRAAEAGKHVLCEKPLALNVAECDDMISAAEWAGVVVIEAVMYLHHPLLLKARQLVQEGAVGRVTLVRGAFSFFLDRVNDVRWKPELGGGSLWDVGSYPVSFIRWIAGEPAEVFGWHLPSSSGVDASFAGVLRCKDGVLGIFDSGFRHPFRTEAEVIGTEGTLVIEQPFIIGPESRILLRRGAEDEVEYIVPEISAYQCEVEALTAAVLDGEDLPVPLASSRANVATLSALYESARLGKPRDIPGI
jgi:xylose dehydrogenase (NAD/NADP)